jgi:hypothetical protein
MNNYSTRIVGAAAAACIGASVVAAGAALAIDKFDDGAVLTSEADPYFVVAAVGNARSLSDNRTPRFDSNTNAILNLGQVVQPTSSTSGLTSVALLLSAFLCMGWLGRKRRRS